MSPTQDLSKLSEAELMRMEREVAARHIDKFPYLAVVWAFSNLAVWLALWPLVFMGVIPLWLGFIVATLNIMLSYLPSHEAQHDIIAKPGTKLRWLNQLVGHLSTIPLVLPYRVAKITHMDHHKHANDPELDPDYGTHADGPLHAIWKSLDTIASPARMAASMPMAKTLFAAQRPHGCHPCERRLSARALRHSDRSGLVWLCARSGSALVAPTAYRTDLYSILSQLGAA